MTKEIFSHGLLTEVSEVTGEMFHPFLVSEALACFYIKEFGSYGAVFKSWYFDYSEIHNEVPVPPSEVLEFELQYLETTSIVSLSLSVGVNHEGETYVYIFFASASDDYDFCYFVDIDAIPGRDTLRTHLEALKSHIDAI